MPKPTRPDTSEKLQGPEWGPIARALIQAGADLTATVDLRRRIDYSEVFIAELQKDDAALKQAHAKHLKRTALDLLYKQASASGINISASIPGTAVAEAFFFGLHKTLQAQDSEQAKLNFLDRCTVTSLPYPKHSSSYRQLFMKEIEWFIEDRRNSVGRGTQRKQVAQLIKDVEALKAENKMLKELMAKSIPQSGEKVTAGGMTLPAFTMAIQTAGTTILDVSASAAAASASSDDDQPGRPSLKS
jgi:hypothetical protein